VRKLVILRPEPGASTTFERAIQASLDAVKLPLFAIEPVEWQAPDLTEFDGLLATSANVFNQASEEFAKLRALAVYAVGPATAAAARKAGFTVAGTGQAGLRKLLSSIDPDLRLLHLAGEDRMDWRLAWQKITSVTAYRARPLDVAQPRVLEDAVLMIHSPRAGARLAELDFDKSRTAIAAISEAAAVACGEGWDEVASIRRPDDSALVALAARLCEKQVGR
jgi:uroporphyrinogen-III synthase